MHNNQEWFARSGGDSHKSLAYATFGLYAVTASLALFAPSRLDEAESGGWDTVSIHKMLALVHFAAMLSLPVLGAKIVKGGPGAARRMQDVGWGGFSVRVPIRTMTTENRNRDSNMLDTLGYPKTREIVFRANQTVIDGSQARISGVLLINGIEKNIEFSAKAEKQDADWIVSGDFTILMTDFGLERPRVLFLVVADEVKISFRVQLDLKPQ